MRQYVDTGLVALDLANTWDEYLDEPERLPDPAALRRFCEEFGENVDTPLGGTPGQRVGEEPGERAGGERVGGEPGVPAGGETGERGDFWESELAAVREMRGRLRAVLACEPSERTRALAGFAAGLSARADVEDVDGVPVLRLVALDGAGMADRLAVRAVRELLDVAAAGDWVRLRLCAASPCRDAFIDRSRPGRRQFCSTRCANRAHAAASRARHRT
ncbi:CGNR zinc finger domain-containing protein [Nonomuraea sp. NEAU-A123]|uniref:CGNR zinc finger domain-containing protein n=1 Tax=Nonomuraea sp. NEAU-A123 TaxID=2839649 RepID=UPI001BE48400|nr:CGNR zinc finger domain-containing protein [Nonomuraea sp. NEAU-A123]MBT2230399.1 CGNR zinc finger domain-containing protein [Nonomuraea sp. NEAU-A123]